jgi:putative FmdB family regulatory protein
VPIYEYKCSKCGHIEDVFYFYSTPFKRDVSCSKCGHTANKKISKFVNLFNPTKRGGENQ